MEALLSPHPHAMLVCHCVACQMKGWNAAAGNGIWSDVVICGVEGTCCGALTDTVNGAFEERSGDDGVCPVIGCADGRAGCPECSPHSFPGASSPVNGASGGDGGTNHPCCTFFRLSSGYLHCCYLSYYGVYSYPVCPGSGVCGCYGDGGSGGQACADLTRVSSCPRSGMFYEGLVESWNPMAGGADCQEVPCSLPKQFEPR